MSVLPEEPVSPREFIESVVPSLFAAVELDASQEAQELRLGVVLRDTQAEGEGGEWTLHFVGKEVAVSEGRHEACDLTIVQSVADWRAAIWEGRPALVADVFDRVRAEGPEALRGPTPPGGERPDPLRGISDLSGLIEGVVEGSDVTGAADWRIGVQIGGGPLPEAPQATIRLGAHQADEIRAGRLHPLEALITGQLQLDGDLGLILQLQAVAMSISMAAGGT